MKRTLAVVIVALCSVLAVGTAAADVPPLVLMEGRLSDDQGQPVDGDVTLSFQFFTQEVDGEPLAVGDPDPNTEITVPVTAGVFRQWLALPSETLGDAEALWVEVTVHEGQDSETMTPRLEVVSVPYALRSGASFFAEECGECVTSLTCSCTLDDFDLTPYATITWVEGTCVTEEDLLAELADYCKADEQGQCGDITQNDVQVYLTENGYLKLPGDEGILLAFLADNGFNACECYGDAEVAAYLGANDFHAGPHYGDSDVEAVLAAKGYCTECYADNDVGSYLALYCAANPSSALCYGDADVAALLAVYCDDNPDSELCAPGGLSCSDCQDIFNWALADAPGGEALFAQNSDLLDGMDSLEFEPAGTAVEVVGQHESDWAHLTSEEAGILTGGSNADALHVHSGGSIGGLGPGLITSEMTKKYLSTDTPKPTPLPDPAFDFYSFQSAIDVPDFGSIQAISIGVDLLHGDLSEVKLELNHDGDNILLADVGDLSGEALSVEWTPDDVLGLSGFIGTELNGEWKLQYTDGINTGGNAGAVTSWFLQVEFVSSEVVIVKGDFVVEGHGLYGLIGQSEIRNKTGGSAKTVLCSVVVPPNSVSNFIHVVSQVKTSSYSVNGGGCSGSSSVELVWSDAEGVETVLALGSGSGGGCCGGKNDKYSQEEIVFNEDYDLSSGGEFIVYGWWSGCGSGEAQCYNLTVFGQ